MRNRQSHARSFLAVLQAICAAPKWLLSSSLSYDRLYQIVGFANKDIHVTAVSIDERLPQRREISGGCVFTLALFCGQQHERLPWALALHPAASNLVFLKFSQYRMQQAHDFIYAFQHYLSDERIGVKWFTRNMDADRLAPPSSERLCAEAFFWGALASLGLGQRSRSH
jgi:hypothetical protein